MQAHSVKDLLAQAATQPLPNYNKYTVVCPLPAEGMDRYLLRITLPPRFNYDLETTSSLSPIHYISENYGQNLLEGGMDCGQSSFQIVLQRSGVSLWHLFQEKASKPGMDPTQATQEAYTHVLGLLDALPMSSFVDLARQINYLSSQGIKADLLPNNIMLDGTKLHLIDIHNGPHYQENTLSNLQQKWLKFHPLPDRNFSSPALGALYHILNRKIEEAAQIAGLPRDTIEAECMFPPAKITFRTPVRIQTIAELPLSATPHELRERLEQVERHNGLNFTRR